MRQLLLGFLIFGRMSVAMATEPVDFNRDIRPILSDNCFHCHGHDAASRQADLRLDSRLGLFGDGDVPGVVVGGRPEQSELVRRTQSDDEGERMPPPDSNRQLSREQVELLHRWVAEGATWEQHWSFLPPRRPAVPEVATSDWPLNPVDSFVLKRIVEAGLLPSQEAAPGILARRVSLDLTGLPLTRDARLSLLQSKRPDAYDRLVDRLMASPAYGERMVWPWLDAARYADTNGYQGDPERTMWPWRDWAVSAINDNMPFDQFTLEQIAGDLLPNATLEQALATGFNRNHMFNGEGGRIAEETRVENVFDRVETTSSVWLGMTIGCARCHDHKFDPFTQREYYELFAFFNNTSEAGRRTGGRSGQIAPVIDFATADHERKSSALQSTVDRLADELAQVERKLFPRSRNKTAADSPAAQGLSGNIVSALQRTPAKRSSSQLHNVVNYFTDTQPEYAQLSKRLQQAIEKRDSFNASIPRVMVMDELEKPRTTYVLVRGAYNQLGEPVSADTPAVLPSLPEDERVNRLSLARWLIDETHPLTARVTVNRCWQTIFGTGIVKSVDDFGVQGDKPTHPQLLDWLATEFIATGWDRKRLYRLLVTSAVYRQTSRVAGARTGERSRQEVDPENSLLSRSPRYRLPSWMLRDQALAASGLLVKRIGGPPVKPYQPPGVWEDATFGKKTYVQDEGAALYRRSVYTFWRRIVGPTMFFDSGKRQTCTLTVALTNTPLHALVTLNETTYVESCRALAQLTLHAPARGPAERITFAFRRVLGRDPKPPELKILLSRLEELRKDYQADADGARQLISIGDSPRDSQLDPAAHAAFTGICMILLNLDETLTKQ